MHEVLVNRLGGLSLPRKSVVRLTDRPDMTLDVYRGRKTTMQQQQQHQSVIDYSIAARKALRFIDTFEIVELDSLFSDGHCLLSIVVFVFTKHFI